MDARNSNLGVLDVCSGKYGFIKKSMLVGGMLLALTSPAIADVIAPQAPPELSDTLTDFRTKEQLTEQLYIEGKVDEQNSLQVPTVSSDLKSLVMRLSGMYQAHYEIVVPRYGVSVVRFYDLEGSPVEIASLKLDQGGYIAEKTAVPYELILRQFQGAEDTLLKVNFKKYRVPAILKLRPVVLVNQQQPVRTLINVLTLNYNAESSRQKVYPYKFQASRVLPSQNASNAPIITKVDMSEQELNALEQNLLQSALVVMPLTVSEQVDAQEVLEKISEVVQPSSQSFPLPN